MGLSHYNLKVYCTGTAVEYPVFTSNGKRGTQAYDRKNNISKVGYTLSNQAKRKIKNVILYRFYKSHKNKFDRMKFFTFTVPAEYYHSFKDHQTADQFFIKKLSSTLENLTKNYDLRGYVWTAEKTKAGVIHFHCIFDCSMIKAVRISSTWAYSCGFEDFRNSVHFGFETKYGHKQTKIKDAKKLMNYLTDYVSKQDDIIYGRGYGMNKFFSDSFQHSYKTFEGGSVGVSARQYDCIKYSKALDPIVIMDDGISKQICCYIYIMDFDMSCIHFFPELWNPDNREFAQKYGLQEEIFA
jgi:hypothetical protein